MEKIPAHWLQSIGKGDYRALAEQTASTSTVELDKKLLTALWHSRARRALGEGADANSALLEVASGKFSASAQEIAALAEELVQCAYYEMAGRLAELLESFGAVHADYIWAMLWREREDWPRCEAALEKLRQRGEAWHTLASIQAAWAAMRQGRHELAESLLAPLVRKLLAYLVHAPSQGLGNLGFSSIKSLSLPAECTINTSWSSAYFTALSIQFFSGE